MVTRGLEPPRTLLWVLTRPRPGPRTRLALLTALAPERHAAVEAWTARHGLLAVVVARLAPAVPDAPMSYAAGLAGVTALQIGLGTLVASTPRAFAYTALGGSLDGLTSPLALVAFVLLGVTMVGGALLARAHVRRSRTAARAMAELVDGSQ